VAAYLMWGLFPLYFALLDAVTPLEIIAHRVIWSLLFLLIIIAIARQWKTLRINKRTLMILSVAAVLLSINWLTYVYAISINEVAQASLGYFINPLVTVALGVVVLSEKLRRAQWWAVGIAIVAVAVLTVGYGQLPWISLTLAASFGLYGLLKKQANVGAVPSLLWETVVLAPVALIYLGVLESQGTAAFVQDGWDISILLVLLGPITALPLLAFGASATRIPLSSLGVLQYITPVVQFILAITVFAEAMTATRWVGFALVWLALIVVTTDMTRSARARIVTPID